MAGSVVDGIPHEASVAALAALGAEVAAAAQLPGGEALLDIARNAFTKGLQVTALISGLVVLGMAAIVVIPLRSAPGRSV